MSVNGGCLRRGAQGAAALAAGLLACAGTALGALPTVPSGALPGPPVLYAEPPSAPQLSNSAPFTAAPLLVSGTDAYRDGEYLYQDYLFDDRGADTAPGLGARPDNLENSQFSPTAGDLLYPTDPSYAGNAADLVEFRIRPTATAIVYRVTLNHVAANDAAVVGIGIDSDRSGGTAVPWPLGAGVSSPGLDLFITAWGTGGEVTTLPGGATQPLPAGSVSINSTTRQMTISVPRSVMDPGTETWRYVTGVGLWDAAGHSWRQPAAGSQPGEHTPASGSILGGDPAVFNLGFRFDEPQFKQPDEQAQSLPYSTGPGVGNWYEDKQAYLLGPLGGRSTNPGAQAALIGEDFAADVNFAKLAAAATEDVHPPGATQARIFASSLDPHPGVQSDFPQYGGRLQPYVLHVPQSVAPAEPAGLTFALHSLGGTYTQFAVFSPNQLTQFGDERGNLVATPLGRGPDGWYTGAAEVDTFEVWADINRHFALDPDRSYLSGYSMGGYGTYKYVVHYPDLWASAFTTVGPPGEGVWVPPGDPSGGPETLTNSILENARWVPFHNWVGLADELVPVAGPIEQQRTFDALGLRSETLIFGAADHFALAVTDEWGAARDFLGDAARSGDPSRVDYGFFPAADRPALGLAHDHAYWVSGLTARDAGGGDAIGRISARSLAFGEGDPATQALNGAGADAGPPLPYVSFGTAWTGIPAVAAENTLKVSLATVATANLDGERARLAGEEGLRIEISTDGQAEVRLRLPLPAGARFERIAGPGRAVAPEVSVDGAGATFSLPSAGDRVYVLSAAPSPGGGGGGTPALRSGRCANTLNGTRAADRLTGSRFGDRIFGFRGNDRIAGGAGDDCLWGQRGRDVLKGHAGNDVIRGSAGRDRIAGGGGRDVVKAGLGADRIFANDGRRDLINCGPGRDTVNADRRDRLFGCERILGPAGRGR